jgi:hypothetical protein
VNYVGTGENQPLELHVNGARALRLEPDASISGAPNVIGGSSNNIVDAGVVGAFIGGGGAGNLGGSGSTNRISANFCVIGGGVGNTIPTNTTGSYGTGSTIGGGWQNTIQTNCQVSTIAGGSGNIIQTNTYGASIGGGIQNIIHAFYPGRDDKSITTLEFDGVELAAIQGLNQKLETRLKQKDEEIEALKARTDELKQRLLSLEQAVNSMHSSNP